MAAPRKPDFEMERTLKATLPIGKQLENATPSDLIAAQNYLNDEFIRLGTMSRGGARRDRSTAEWDAYRHWLDQYENAWRFLETELGSLRGVNLGPASSSADVWEVTIGVASGEGAESVQFATLGEALRHAVHLRKRAGGGSG